MAPPNNATARPPQSQSVAQNRDQSGFEEVANLPGDLLAAGKGLQKVGTPFVTAIRVQQPRDLDKFVAAIDKEAEYAGEEFWYAWTQGGERIEGPTIGLANSLAREWMNCAVTCELQENDEAFYITARFIDLEKGAQQERIFRQRKGGVHGKYDADRKLDIALQIGQSKAIRNVVVNAVPRWMVQRAIEKAKDAVARKIDPKKLDEFKDQVKKFFGERGVTVEQLVAKAKKPMAEWTTRDIADFGADKKALLAGEVSINDLFPIKDATPASTGPVNETTTAGGTLKPEPREPGADEGEPGTPSPEEQKAINDKLAKEEQESRDKANQGGAAPPAGKKPDPKKGGLFS